MERRADIQYLTAILFQLGECRATNVECSLEIDVHDRAKSIRRQLFRRTKKIPCRAVYDDIDFAKAFDGGSDCLFNFFGVANVGGDREGFTDGRVRGFGALPYGRATAPRFVDP